MIKSWTNQLQTSLATRSQSLVLLCWIRTVVLAGQLTALAYARVWLRLDLDYGWLVIVLIGNILLLTFTWYRARSVRVVSDAEFFALLAAEVVVFSWLIYFSGGSTNPFVFYYLVPLSVSAATLPPRLTWLLAALCVSVYTLLLFFYRELPIFGMAPSGSMVHSPHILGMWINFLVSAFLVGVFVSRMALLVRKQDLRLAELNQQQQEDQQLLALAALAAGTAHELGTPLSTIAIQLEELGEMGDFLEENRQSIRLALEQVSRCRTILNSLRQTAQDAQLAEQPRISVGQLVKRIVEPCLNLYPDVRLKIEMPPEVAAQLVQLDLPTQQGLISLLHNAVDASRDASKAEVWLDADIQTNRLLLAIRDAGPGLSPEVAERLGQAFVTSKADGTGLGVFLARAAIQRAGGLVNITNYAEGGTIVEIELPLVESEAQDNV